METLVIEYDPFNGEVVPDGMVHEYVDDIISANSDDTEVIVGSVVLFDAFRLAIKKKKIDNRKVKLRFNEEEYQPDENGKLNYWPPGLCYIYDEILDGLIIEGLMPRNSSIS